MQSRVDRFHRVDVHDGRFRRGDGIGEAGRGRIGRAHQCHHGEAEQAADDGGEQQISNGVRHGRSVSRGEWSRNRSLTAVLRRSRSAIRCRLFSAVRSVECSLFRGATVDDSGRAVQRLSLVARIHRRRRSARCGRSTRRPEPAVDSGAKRRSDSGATLESAPGRRSKRNGQGSVHVGRRRARQDLPDGSVLRLRAVSREVAHALPPVHASRPPRPHTVCGALGSVAAGGGGSGERSARIVFRRILRLGHRRCDDPRRAARTPVRRRCHARRNLEHSAARVVRERVATAAVPAGDRTARAQLPKC